MTTARDKEFEVYEEHRTGIARHVTTLFASSYSPLNWEKKAAIRAILDAAVHQAMDEVTPREMDEETRRGHARAYFELEHHYEQAITNGVDAAADWLKRGLKQISDSEDAYRAALEKEAAANESTPINNREEEK